jgi:hypothetical protein
MIQGHTHHDKMRHHLAMPERVHTTRGKPSGRPQHRSPNSSTYEKRVYHNGRKHKAYDRRTLVQRSFIVTVVNLFSLVFFITIDARGQ